VAYQYREAADPPSSEVRTWWPDGEKYEIKCSDCGQWSPALDWVDGHVECETCGDHNAIECPHCGEPIDYVFGRDSVERRLMVI